MLAGWRGSPLRRRRVRSACERHPRAAARPRRADGAARSTGPLRAPAAAGYRSRLTSTGNSALCTKPRDTEPSTVEASAGIHYSMAAARSAPEIAAMNSCAQPSTASQSVYVGRRRGRAALIVVGLMLGTTIFSSALVTGDTMSRTIRSSVTSRSGTRTSSCRQRRRREPDARAIHARAVLRRARPRTVERALRPTGQVDGVAPAIIERVALQDLTTRQTESRVSLFASDPARMQGFGAIRDTEGRQRSLADLDPGDVFLNRDAADDLGARRAGCVCSPATARTSCASGAIVDHDGTGSDGAAILLPLIRAQALMGRTGAATPHPRVQPGRRDLGRGGDRRRGARVGAGARAARARAAGGQARGLELADRQGDVFVSIFTTFGSFSIAAGVLLILLIFVMLSAERRCGAGHRAGDRDAAGAPRADVRVRRARLRPRRRGDRRRPRCRRRVRDGRRAGRCAQHDGVRIYAVSLRSVVVAYGSACCSRS